MGRGDGPPLLPSPPLPPPHHLLHPQDGSEEWRLLPQQEKGADVEGERRPLSHKQLTRPMSRFAREQCSGAADPQFSTRFRGENVLVLDLDMPERTTADYEQDVNPNVRAALSAALQDEEEIEMDAEENLPSMGGGQGNWMPGMEQGGRARTPPKRKPRRRKPKEDGLDAGLDALLADDSSKAPAPEAFPESRGLVRNRY